MYTVITSSPEETMELGKKIAKKLKSGDIIAFTGELGAGKTCMIQGICFEFGVKDSVSSPTFTLIQEYKGNIPIYHFDLYRLREEDLFDLGYWEYFEGKGICLIEWADRAENLLPKNHINIKLEYPDISSSEDMDKRKITITGREDVISNL